MVEYMRLKVLIEQKSHQDEINEEIEAGELDEQTRGDKLIEKTKQRLSMFVGQQDLLRGQREQNTIINAQKDQLKLSDHLSPTATIKNQAKISRSATVNVVKKIQKLQKIELE